MEQNSGDESPPELLSGIHSNEIFDPEGFAALTWEETASYGEKTRRSESRVNESARDVPQGSSHPEYPAPSYPTSDSRAGHSDEVFSGSHKIKSRPKVADLRASSLTLNQLSSEEYFVFREEVGNAILGFLELGRPVVLESFGLLVPLTETRTSVLSQGPTLAITRGNTTTVVFEKCLDTTGILGERFPNACESSEIARLVRQRLPLTLQRRWDARAVRTLFRCFVRELKRNVVELGHSRELSPIGVFYSLHNRQGSSFSDWYAGADIFLRSAISIQRNPYETKLCEAPLIASSFELFEAGYGAPLVQSDLDLHQELSAAGFPQRLIQDLHIPAGKIQIAAFRSTAPRSAQQRSRGEDVLTFVSEGARKVCPHHTGRFEFTFHVPYSGKEDVGSIVGLARSMIACGIVTSLGDNSHPAFANTALSLHKSLDSLAPAMGLVAGRLSALTLTTFDKLPYPQRTQSDQFEFLTVLGISESEADLITKLGKHHAEALLEARGLRQVTVLERSCVLMRSFIQVGRSTFGRQLASVEHHAEAH